TQAQTVRWVALDGQFAPARALADGLAVALLLALPPAVLLLLPLLPQAASSEMADAPAITGSNCRNFVLIVRWTPHIQSSVKSPWMTVKDRGGSVTTSLPSFAATDPCSRLAVSTSGSTRDLYERSVVTVLIVASPAREQSRTRSSIVSG